jgi:hypothetical protein
MDALEPLDRLARRARQEQTPVFDVADKVRLRIRAEGLVAERSDGLQSVTLIPMGVFGGLAALAASITVVLAIELWSYMSNPVMELLTPLQEIQLW